MGVGPGILATFQSALWLLFGRVLATFDIITENQLSTPNVSVLIYWVLQMEVILHITIAKSSHNSCGYVV